MNNPLRRFQHLWDPRGRKNGHLNERQIQNRVRSFENMMGPTSHAAGVRTYKASEDSKMKQDREAFIAAQPGPCCKHGRAFKNSDGEAATAEFIPEYRLCKCCSTVRKGPSYMRNSGDEHYCSICARDELIVAGIEVDPKVQVAMIEVEGWELVSLEEALERLGSNRLMSHNAKSAIRSAQKTGESLWRSRKEEQIWTDIIEKRHKHDLARGIERPTRPERKLEDQAEILGFSGALIRSTEDRLARIEKS